MESLSKELPAAARSQASAALAALHDRLGEALHAVVAYGSAVRGGFVKAGSDLNLLVVLNESSVASHAALAEVVQRSKLKIEPFVVPKAELAATAKAFAAKFLSIKRTYQVLYGPDVMAELAVDPRIERFLVEQALRNLSLRLVHAFVTRAHRGRAGQGYWRFLHDTVSVVVSEVSSVLRCSGIAMPNAQAERLPLIEQHLQVDTTVLRELFAERASARLRPRRHTAEDALATHARLCAITDAALRWVDEAWAAS